MGFGDVLEGNSDKTWVASLYKRGGVGRCDAWEEDKDMSNPVQLSRKAS